MKRFIYISILSWLPFLILLGLGHIKISENSNLGFLLGILSMMLTFFYLPVGLILGEMDRKNIINLLPAPIFYSVVILLCGLTYSLSKANRKY